MQSVSTVAVKSISKKNIKSLPRLKRELLIMRAVDHPNIIKLHEVYEDEKYMHIVSEIYTGLDLFDDIME